MSAKAGMNRWQAGLPVSDFGTGRESAGALISGKAQHKIYHILHHLQAGGTF